LEELPNRQAGTVANLHGYMQAVKNGNKKNPLLNQFISSGNRLHYIRNTKRTYFLEYRENLEYLNNPENILNLALDKKLDICYILGKIAEWLFRIHLAILVNVWRR
jgi:hypothetical protein